MIATHFNEWIDEAVEQALATGSRSFPEFIASLPGIYPEEVIRSLHRIGGRLADKKVVVDALIASARRQEAVAPSASGLLGLPPPHPLDFEWRFSSKAIETLWDVAFDLMPDEAQIALVGTPSLAVTPFKRLAGYSTDYYGMDDYPRAPGQLRAAYMSDVLCNARARQRYDLVAMDPPWYAEHLQRFLFFGTSALADRGHLLLAMPALGTRPGIQREHELATQWADKLGLSLLSTMHAVLSYETPPFERNALRAAGVLNVGSEWRRADLWVLRKMRSSAATWPGDLFHNPWREFRFGPVRIRVDTAAIAMTENAEARSIVLGDVLPSVSRRDPRRHEARIWTTGNRIFGCDSPGQYAEVVAAWQGGRSNLGASEAAIRHLSDLVTQETHELAWPK